MSLLASVDFVFRRETAIGLAIRFNTHFEVEAQPAATEQDAMIVTRTEIIDELSVEFVEPDSESALLGINAGDSVTHLNLESVMGMARERARALLRTRPLRIRVLKNIDTNDGAHGSNQGIDNIQVTNQGIDNIQGTNQGVDNIQGTGSNQGINPLPFHVVAAALGGLAMPAPHFQDLFGTPTTLHPWGPRVWEGLRRLFPCELSRSWGGRAHLAWFASPAPFSRHQAAVEVAEDQWQGRVYPAFVFEWSIDLFELRCLKISLAGTRSWLSHRSRIALVATWSDDHWVEHTTVTWLH